MGGDQFIPVASKTGAGLELPLERRGLKNKREKTLTMGVESTLEKTKGKIPWEESKRKVSQSIKSQKRNRDSEERRWIGVTQ